MSKSIVAEKAIIFSVESIRFYKSHFTSTEDRILARQFLRSSTSLGANLAEANGAYSRKEFTSKVSIAYKEARETQYWLTVFERSKLISESDALHLQNLATELCRMLYSILRTTRNTT